MPIVIGPSFRAVARFGLCCTVLFFFMAGLLLHFECASLGAYRIPLVAGPLIPSRLGPDRQNLLLHLLREYVEPKQRFRFAFAPPLGGPLDAQKLHVGVTREIQQ